MLMNIIDGGDEYGHMAKSVPVAIPNQMRGSVSHQSGSDSEEDTPDPHQMQVHHNPWVK